MRSRSTARRRFTDREILEIRLDPRPSPAVARELACSEALIRQVRGGLGSYAAGPWPDQMPGWSRRGGLRGRAGLRGERNPSAKLTLPAVRWLRRRRERGDVTYAILAELAWARWGVRISERSVCAACRGETWREEG